MARRSGFSSFMGGLANGMNMGMKYDEWSREKAMQDEMKTAGSMDPSRTDTNGNYEEAMGLTGASTQAKMLQEQDSAFGQEGARSTAEALNSNAADQTTADASRATTKTSYSMGGKSQEAPFSPEQIDAGRYRGQADVLTKYGKTERAAALNGLARQREDEGRQAAIGEEISAGLAKAGPNLTEAKKAYLMHKHGLDAAIKNKDWNAAQKFMQGSAQSRTALMDDIAQRAYRDLKIGASDEVMANHLASQYALIQTGDDPQGFKIAGPAHIVGKMDNGTAFELKPGEGESREQFYSRIISTMSDPKIIMAAEQKRLEKLAERAGKRDDFTFEENNKVRVIKDADGNERMVTVAGGGSGGMDGGLMPGGMRDPSPKVMKRHDDFFEKVYPTKVDPLTGEKSTDPRFAQAKKLVSDMEVYRNFGDHRLTDADVQQAAMDALDGKAKIKQRMFREVVPGQPDRTIAGQAIVYDDGRVIRLKSSQQPPDSIRPNIKPNIRPQSPGLSPVAPQSKASPAGFPRVSPEQQAQRDALAGELAVQERGADSARRDLAELDAALRSPRLDGTQRQILQTERNRIASGLATAG